MNAIHFLSAMWIKLWKSEYSCHIGANVVRSSAARMLTRLDDYHDDVIKWKHFPICAGNSPVPGEFPAQRPVTRSFDVFFDLRLNKWLNKQSSGWWFETLSLPLWRHSNDVRITYSSYAPAAERGPTGFYTDTELTSSTLPWFLRLLTLAQMGKPGESLKNQLRANPRYTSLLGHLVLPPLAASYLASKSAWSNINVRSCRFNFLHWLSVNELEKKTLTLKNSGKPSSWETMSCLSRTTKIMVVYVWWCNESGISS